MCGNPVDGKAPNNREEFKRTGKVSGLYFNIFAKH